MFCPSLSFIFSLDSFQQNPYFIWLKSNLRVVEEAGLDGEAGPGHTTQTLAQRSAYIVTCH